MVEPTRTENVQQALQCKLGVALATGNPETLDEWVSSVAQKTKLPIRWNYVNGVAVLVCFCSKNRRRKCELIKTMNNQQYCLNGKILTFSGMSN